MGEKVVMKALHATIVFAISTLLLVPAVLKAAEPADSASTQVQETKKPKSKIAQRLLRQAEQAMQRKRLTRPVHNNALDLYTAVLLLDPHNARAERGLELVADTLVARTKEWAERKRWAQARLALDELQRSFPDHPQVEQLQQAIGDLSSLEKKKTVKQESSDLFTDTVAIDAGELRSKSDQVVAVLKLLAERLAHSDESILIYARNDAEGRWMYKIMKDHVPDYRIRGDIRIAREPVIKLLLPIPN